MINISKPKNNIIFYIIISFILFVCFWFFLSYYRNSSYQYPLRIGNKSYTYNDINSFVKLYGINDNNSARVIASVINQLIFATEARKANIRVTNSMLEEYLLSIPIFKKGISEEVLNNIIRYYNVTEFQLKNVLSTQLAVDILLTVFMNINFSYDELSSLVLKNNLISNSVEVFRMPFDLFLNIRKPTLNELNLLYRKQNLFTTAKSSIKYSIIDIDRIINLKKFDQRLQKIFNKNIELYSVSEMRNIKQLQLKSYQDIDIVLKKLRSGISFTNVARMHSKNFDDIDIGFITQNDFETEVSNELFKLEIGQCTNVIKTFDDYFIFKIDKIQAKRKLTYKEIKNSKNFDILKKNFIISIIQTVNKMINDGRCYDNIIRDFHVVSREITVTENDSLFYFNQINNKVDFLINAFNKNRRISFFPISEEKFCLIYINKIQSKYKMTFQEAIKRLKEIYLIEQIPIIVNKLIFKYKNENIYIKNGIDVIDFNNIKKCYETISKVTNNSILPKDFINEQFYLKENEFSAPFIDYNSKNVFITLLKYINNYESKKFKIYYDFFDTQIFNIEKNMFIEEYLNYLKRKYLIDINDKFMFFT